MGLYEKINLKIKRLREGKHWSQGGRDGAKLEYVPKITRENRTRGETSASLGRLEQVAAVFGIGLCELLADVCGAARCTTDVMRMMRAVVRKMYYCCNRRVRLLN